MSRKSSRRCWTKSFELWRAEIEWNCGASACFQLSSAKRGPAAILVRELPSRSHRKLCPPSRLQKKCKSDLIRKLRRWIEQQERSRNFSRDVASPIGASRPSNFCPTFADDCAKSPAALS